jgi:hypothetical protein
MLHHHQEHAVWIASYLALFNTAEASVVAAFERALGGDGGRDAITLLSPIANTSTRIAVVRDFLASREGTANWIYGALPAIKTIAGCAGFRNRLAHGLYASNGDQLSLLDSFVGVRKATSTNLTIDDLKAEYAKLENAVAQLMLATAAGFSGKIDT